MRFLTGFNSKLRHAVRCTNPGILAYYWEGGVPSGHPIKEISSTGAFISTSQRWYIGTILTLTLQSDAVATEAADTLLVSCRVARHEADGVGVSFLFTSAQDRKALEKFVRRIRAHGNGKHRGSNGDGQALIEYALVVPMLFFLIVGAVDFGGYIYSWVTVANAARAVADYAAMSGAYAGGITPATATQLSTLLTNDTASLPNTAPSLVVCQNINGTSTSITGTCSSPPGDPENIIGATTTCSSSAPCYVSVTVDVTYNYVPFIPTFNFPGFHIPFANPTSIHRRTVIRSIQ
jgi:Flp pilus assembly protein TadG